jgi:hypothetical protein
MSDQAAVAQTEPTPTPSPTPTPEPTPAPTPAPESESPKEAGSLLGGEAIAEATPFDPEAIKFPEGITKEDPLFAEFSQFAQESKLNGAVAQKIIDLAAKQAAASSEKLLSDWNKQQEEWQNEIKADKHIGGDKLAGTLQTFSKVANDPALSDPKFREGLALTGAGNHPAVVRTLARWAMALSEGGPVRGGPTVSNGRAPETLGQAIYGQNGPHSGGPRFT